ncbi:cupin domain-containing protein [Candidatus Woesearchaeota archaeon]|nr:cupin domain-containing protein [Candidatus Woesearchaeota archaeon]
MFIRELEKCKTIVAGDNTMLRVLFNPLVDKLNLKYSLAHAIVKPNEITQKHKLKSSEVYYILQGEGIMFIDDKSNNVKGGQAIYIPPDSIQKIQNVGNTDLAFLCIVEPAWKTEDEEILE